MNTKIGLVIIMSVLSLNTLAGDAVTRIIPIDGGSATCVSDSGTEIKLNDSVSAPYGKAWLDVQVLKGGSAPKELSCYPSMNTTKIKARVGTANVMVDAITRVDMHLYADCGSGWANIGKTISIECNLQVQEIDLP